jgi:hypothetical protein
MKWVFTRSPGARFRMSSSIWSQVSRRLSQSAILIPGCIFRSQSRTCSNTSTLYSTRSNWVLQEEIEP